MGTTSADEESRRYEGRAGRFDKIETTGTGPCPCISSKRVLSYSYRRLDYFPDRYSRGGTRRGCIRFMFGIWLH